MPKIVLGVIGNGRKDLLAQTIAAAEDFIDHEFDDKIMINDAPSPEYNAYLEQTYGDRFRVISHDKNMGLSGSVQSLWMMSQMIKADYIFHLEEDFVVNKPITLQPMLDLLEINWSLAQVSLKRQAVNGEESQAGGFMQLHPERYKSEFVWSNNGKEVYWVEQNWLFSLNPCLYPIEITRVGWPQGGGEREFTNRLIAERPQTKFAILGKKEDPPLVTHIGSYRGENWFV